MVTVVFVSYIPNTYFAICTSFLHKLFVGDRNEYCFD